MLSFTAFKHPRKLGPASYVQWVMNPLNGLQAKVTEGKYNFLVNYLPAEFMIIKEARGKRLGKKEFEEKKDELKNTEYYSLLIDLNNGRKNVVQSLVDDTKTPADDMVKYLAYDLQRDIKLVDGTDTLKCRFLHLEETYEVTSYARFMAVFDVPEKKEKDDRVILLSLPWMNHQKMTFTITKENLLSVPRVSVKK